MEPFTEYQGHWLVSNRRAVPVEFKGAGLSDAFSVGEAFPGAMAVLQNLIPNPGSNGQWVPRPGAIVLTGTAVTPPPGGPPGTGTTNLWGTMVWGQGTWTLTPAAVMRDGVETYDTSQPGPSGDIWGQLVWGTGHWGASFANIQIQGNLQGIYVVGHRIFGMISATTGANAGKDVPFVYDVSQGGFVNMQSMNAVFPTSQPPTGDWVPIRFAAFPGRVVVTHPNFSKAAPVGWFDYSGYTNNSHSGKITAGSKNVTTITPAANLAGWQVGYFISSSGIPPGTTIVSVSADGTSLVLSAAATATSTAVLTVTGGTPNNIGFGVGNTNITPLIDIPKDVFNFNGRAYYAVPGSGLPPGIGMQFSDQQYPLQITNPSQQLTPANGLDVTCFGGLPINQTQTGPIQTLFAFQGDSNILKITGDAALQTLRMDSVPNGLGTLAPNSIASTPLGLAFIAPDGLRYVDFDGNAQTIVGANGEGVNLPLINALYPSRINCAYNEDVYRMSLQNGAKINQPWEDYWLHVTRKQFSGPHTDPSCVVAAFQQFAGAINGHGFVYGMQGFPGNIYLGSVIPNSEALFTENGQELQCVWQTCYTQDNQRLTENAIVESTFLAAVSDPAGITATIINEKQTVLDQVTISPIGSSLGGGGPPVTGSTLWGAFTWGQDKWGGLISSIPTTSTPIMFQRDMAWHLPIVFKQASLRLTASAGDGLVLGVWRYNNIMLAYRLETFGGYV